jgi:UDP-N-acetylmuramyl tripeptide synthase
MMVLALGTLALGGSALMPGVDTAQAAPALRNVDSQYTPGRADRFSSDAFADD